MLPYADLTQNEARNFITDFEYVDDNKIKVNFANNDLPKCIEKGDNFALGCKINQNIEWKSDYPNEKSEDFYNILYSITHSAAKL